MTRPYHYIRPYQFKLMPIEEPDEETLMLEAVDTAEAELKSARKNLDTYIKQMRFHAEIHAERNYGQPRKVRTWYR